MHLELFLVMVLISCAPVVGVLGFFFSPGASVVFHREGCAGNVTLCRVLVVVLITSLLPSVRRLKFPLFDGGAEAHMQLQWGALGLCALWMAGLLASAE
jgi:hypothetical protein